MYHEKPGADSSTRPRIFMYHNMEASGGNGGFDHNSIMRYGGPTNKTTWLSEPNVGDIISQYGYEAKVGNWICNLFIMHKHPQGRAIITQFTSQGDRQHALHNLSLARRNAGATKCVGNGFPGQASRRHAHHSGVWPRRGKMLHCGHCAGYHIEDVNVKAHS
jgi:hypothetical protein